MLTIAGVGFAFDPEVAGENLTFPDSYQPFLTFNHVSEVSCVARYTVLAPDRPRLPALDGTPIWSNEIWRLGPSHSDLVIEIYCVTRSRWVPVARISHDFSEGTIQPFHGRLAAPGPHAINYPYDQAILINRLLLSQICIIHGAGLIIDGKGYVFFGPSGIGKTTISRLWVTHGATLLNDDRVAISQTNAGWILSGTPWHGEEPIVSPLSVPLAGIVRLRQAGETNVRVMSPVEGITELVSCALIPFFSRDGIERSMDMLDGLPDLVPLVELSFKPEPESLRTFLRFMRGLR